MLQLVNVRKSYSTGDFTQVALDDVSLAFRRSEFVAVLGASGSGKTTLLNIIGGLDQYDEGDLAVDGVSTTDYRDRDWDTYRNNRVGFVFQSYNLISHQSVLANVELALTLSGVSRTERRSRALDALDRVGLAEHSHKRPSQLSGGQMQRVAIARALINDPEILLADEPTGALDSQTSVQIMALLTEIASDRLVIMVTHNAALAEHYATRTINLADGAVVRDTSPYLPHQEAVSSEKRARRTHMSFLTALGLSFTNLMTKLGRTLMTAFAGSIGIIGIAAILALAHGVNAYISTVEEDTLSVYPLTIQSQGVDMSMLLAASTELADEMSTRHEAEDGRVHEVQMLTRMLSAAHSNDLGALKEFIEHDEAIEEYVSSVHYSYNIAPHIFSVNPDGSMDQVNPTKNVASGFGSPFSPGGAIQPEVFSELMENTAVVESQYDVMAGRWPQADDELMMVLTPSGEISDFTLYAMGLRDRSERDAKMRQMAEGESISTDTEVVSFTYEEIMGVTFTLAHASDYYVYDEEYGVWVDKHGDAGFLDSLLGSAAELRIVGIVQPREGAAATALPSGIVYTPDLTKRIIDHAAEAEIVARQVSDNRIDVFTGRPFTDAEQGLSRDDFDMSSLISIDQEAIAQAFSIDESKLGLDLSAVDLSMPNIHIPDIGLDPSRLPALNLDGVLDGVELEIDEDEAADTVSELVQAYVQFAMEEGVDPTDVEGGLPLFLDSPRGQEFLDSLDELVTSSQEQLEQRIQTMLGDYLEQSLVAVMDDAVSQVSQSLEQQISAALQGQISSAIDTAMGQLATNMSQAMDIDEEAFADAVEFNLDEDELTELVLAMVMEEESTAEGNLRQLGYADVDRPENIDIYPKDFDSKSSVLAVLDEYNDRMRAQGEEGKVVTYTDIVGTLMSSVTDILKVITYVLIAFVAISLVVSSIMIGVITLISVLERRKEIGILRSIGASKRDIRRVFNAETLIIGFVAGVLGIAITMLLTLPTNAIVSARFGIDKVAQLPWQAAMILVAISMALSFLAGLIPSSAAAREDPVEALRSE